MSKYRFEQVNTLESSIEDKVQQGHIADELKKGIACNYKPFSIVAYGTDKEVLGVLMAYTAFAEIYVDDLWVEPSQRKKGLGRELLAQLEMRFEGKGYNNINLVTSQFQAPAFYEKCGFNLEFVRKNKHNPQLSKSFFIKYFKNETQTQGITGDEQS